MASLTAPDRSAPTVAERLPADGATGVSTSASVVALLSEAVDPATVSPASVRLARAGTLRAARLTVPAAGGYTLRVYMREDGLYLDRLVLARDGAEVPAGDGPLTGLRE